MPCPFAKSAVTEVPTNFTLKTTGSINISNSGKEFIDLAYSMPFVASSADAFITSIVSKKFIEGFEPTYFQIPYLYSLADNLINGNYKSEESIKDNLIVTTYQIPYKSEIKEEVTTITTYLNTETQILWHIIPREFTYNSVEEVSVAIAKLEDGSYKGQYLIPYSFIKKIEINGFITFRFKINTLLNNDNNTNAIPSLSAGQSIANITVTGSNCNGLIGVRSCASITDINSSQCSKYYDYNGKGLICGPNTGLGAQSTIPCESNGFCS